MGMGREWGQREGKRHVRTQPGHGPLGGAAPLVEQLKWRHAPIKQTLFGEVRVMSTNFSLSTPGQDSILEVHSLFD